MATSGGFRPAWNPGVGALGLIVLGAGGGLVLVATNGTTAATALGLFAGGVVLAGAVLVTTVRIGVPLFVRCCRGLARAYRAVRPNSPTVRRMLLAMGVFLLVGVLFLGVGMLAV